MSREQLFRVATVSIKNGNSEISIQNARIRFDITKSMEAKENISHINIFNLGKQTRETIASGNSKLSLKVGYEAIGNLSEIIWGDVVDVSVTKSQSEVLTSISVVSGARKLNTMKISIALNKNPTLEQVLSIIRKKTFYQVKTVGLDTSEIFDTSYSDTGPLDTIMNHLAQRISFKWSLQNNVLILFGIKEISSNVVMTLNKSAGLLINPEAVQLISTKFEQSEEVQSAGRKKLLALLQPNLQIGDTIAVESDDINGNYRVVKIQHTGDTRSNDWYSHIEID